MLEFLTNIQNFPKSMEKRAFDVFRLRKIYNLVSVPFVHLSLAQAHVRIKYFRMKILKTSYDDVFSRATDVNISSTRKSLYILSPPVVLVEIDV